MAIDSAAKRLSAIATRRLPWMRRFQPQPDASMTQEDRQQLGFVYRGIETQDPTIPVAEVTGVIDRVAECVVVMKR